LCCRKHFLSTIGHEGINNMLAAYSDKTIYSVCTFGYCGGPGQKPLLFQGRTEGQLVQARGPLTFGWDACFEYEGETYAEMDKARKVRSFSPSDFVLGQMPCPEKNSGSCSVSTAQACADVWRPQNAISHRGKALEKLKTWLAGGDVETI
jgi:inosine/xanthosine triphosphate pyrophosphatase family protein